MRRNRRAAPVRAAVLAAALLIVASPLSAQDRAAQDKPALDDVVRQLERGEVKIVFDPASRTANLLPARVH